MIRKLVRSVCIAACLAAAARAAETEPPAAPAAKPKATTPASAPTRSRARVYGAVDVDRDKDGKITAVRITSVNKITYKVDLDENGRKLGEQMGGRRASVLGYVSGTGEVRSLAVQSFGEIKKASKEQPKQKAKKRTTTRKRTTKRSSRNKNR